ncbi:MAG TPA: hypothetical protein VM124_03935 [Candidatus Limnocylindrales bacterium]|nr:hypothetical protein [Candidatus Limnocylindrales bacterium]
MPTPYLETSKVQAILEIARLAPSVHNTQPWLVRISGQDLVVSINPAHALTDGDPTGRETMISLGIFTEAIDIGARAQGLKIAAVNLKNKEVIMSMEPVALPDPKLEAAQLLRRRHSDRSIYKPVAITPVTIALVEQASSEGISVQVVTDRVFIKKAADLTAKGIRLALSSPSFRKELRQYLLPSWSHRKRGISLKSLYLPRILSLWQPMMLGLGIGLGAEANLEKKRWESASGIIVICGDGDLERYWLEAGRSYLRASLAAEKAGLSQATSAALVEASNYHEDIEVLLQTNKRILAMIRIGAGSPKKVFSPRIEVADMLTLTSQTSE